MPTPRQRRCWRCEQVWRKGGIEPVDLDIAAGEIVGVAGLLGSGRTELARLLFGLDRRDGGEHRHRRHRRARCAARPRRSAMGSPSARRSARPKGIVDELSVRENIVLALQARRAWRGACRSPSSASSLTAWSRHWASRTADIETPIGQLSGGNQQKVLLARWLATQPRLLILDEPTRGIDIAAKQET